MEKRLAELMRTGVVREGDEIEHGIGRKGAKEGRARITRNGVQVGPETFSTLSGAAKSIGGYAVNGWIYWRHARTGKSMLELSGRTKPRRSS